MRRKKSKRKIQHINIRTILYTFIAGWCKLVRGVGVEPTSVEYNLWSLDTLRITQHLSNTSSTGEPDFLSCLNSSFICLVKPVSMATNYILFNIFIYFKSARLSIMPALLLTVGTFPSQRSTHK